LTANGNPWTAFPDGDVWFVSVLGPNQLGKATKVTFVVTVTDTQGAVTTFTYEAIKPSSGSQC